MNKITIKNIGPIINVDITLNKVNVLMGPQSSGKSTIAKIISFCQWAEKRFMLDGSFDYDFREQFINFHRISESYFSRESSFLYSSDFLTIKYSGLDFKIDIQEKQKDYNYKKTRNIFIPAERNFVSVIPNLARYNETNDNIMNFVYDWFEAKKMYNRKNPLNILNFPISYFYSHSSESDILLLKNSKTELNLKDASSGLQSVTPLIMLIDYLTGEFYKENKAPSVNEKEEIAKIFLRNFGYIIDNIKRLEDLKNNFENNKNSFELTPPESDKVKTLLANRQEYHYTNFIIEEPEQNLFPETQRDLIYTLFQKIQSKKHPHNLTITTHSPFILYAINNCLMGYNVKKKMPKEEQKELLSFKSWIDPKSVSIWQIKDGQTHTILDSRTKTVTKHYFNEILNQIMDEYYEMLSYFEYDSKTAK